MQTEKMGVGEEAATTGVVEEAAGPVMVGQSLAVGWVVYLFGDQ